MQAFYNWLFHNDIRRLAISSLRLATLLIKLVLFKSSNSSCFLPKMKNMSFTEFDFVSKILISGLPEASRQLQVAFF